MRLFAVRVIKDKQPVGLFWAPDPIALWWMIDSVCDPGECEYLRIKDRAAIMWEGRVKATFGGGIASDEKGESKELHELRSKLSFEYALEDLLHESKDDWIKVPFADEPGGGIHELVEQAKMERKARGKSHKAKR